MNKSGSQLYQRGPVSERIDMSQRKNTSWVSYCIYNTLSLCLDHVSNSLSYPVKHCKIIAQLYNSLLIYSTFFRHLTKSDELFIFLRCRLIFSFSFFVSIFCFWIKSFNFDFDNKKLTFHEKKTVLHSQPFFQYMDFSSCVQYMEFSFSTVTIQLPPFVNVEWNQKGQYRWWIIIQWHETIPQILKCFVGTKLSHLVFINHFWNNPHFSTEMDETVGCCFIKFCDYNHKLNNISHLVFWKPN